MARLKHDWITDHCIDFEYKKYVLLAYLKEVSVHFDANELYPFLGDLVNHHHQLVQLKNHKETLSEQFPKNLKGISSEDWTLLYEKMASDDALLAEVEHILSFSLPKFEAYLEEGKQIYDFIENHMNIRPVGVIPLYPDEGYLILRNEHQKRSNVYEFQLTVIQEPESVFRTVRTSYLSTFHHSVGSTPESVKSALITHNDNLPNPATYAVESELAIPEQETFLPIAKRMLVRYIYTEG